MAQSKIPKSSIYDTKYAMEFAKSDSEKGCDVCTV